MSTMARVFELDWKGLNLPRAVRLVVILAVAVIVLELIDQQKYVITVVFAVLFVGVSDPGGEFGNGATRMGIFAVIGALLTLLGFGVGGGGWGSSVRVLGRDLCASRSRLRDWRSLEPLRAPMGPVLVAWSRPLSAQQLVRIAILSSPWSEYTLYPRRCRRLTRSAPPAA